MLRSHILMLLSSAVLMRYLPDGWNIKSVTQLSCPANVKTHLPDFTSKIRIFLSRDPVAINSFTLNAFSFASYFDVSI